MKSYPRAFYLKKVHELFKDWRLLTTQEENANIARFVANIFAVNIFSVLFCRWAFRLQTLQMEVNFRVLYFSRCYVFRVAACRRFTLFLISFNYVNSVYFYDEDITKRQAYSR